MSKPDDIPQDVWNKAVSALDGSYSYDDEVATGQVARAILAAKGEEREECAKIAEDKDHVLGDWGSVDEHSLLIISQAIRNRG